MVDRHRDHSNMNTLEVNYTEFNDARSKDNSSDVILRKLESFMSDISAHAQFAAHNKGNQYVSAISGAPGSRKQPNESPSNETDFGVTFVTYFIADQLI